MPIDSSIYGNIRPIQLDNPLNNYAQIASIQNAQNQNRLADLQYQQAQRGIEEKNALNEAYRGAIGADGEINRNALLSRLASGSAANQIPSIQKTFLDTDKSKAALTKDTLEAAGKRYETWSSAMAPLINKPDLSHDDILTVGNQLERAGVIQPGWKADVPMNALQLPDYVKSVAMRAEQGRKAVEMLMPKVQMVDGGSVITPFNTNTLAGPIGPIAGAAVTTKTATPGEVMTDTRTRSEGAANRAVTIRGQNLADARSREQIEQGKVPAGYRRLDNGNLEAIPGGPAEKDKALTETQGNAAGFGMRAAKANDILNTLESQGTMGKGAGAVEGTRMSLERLPLVGTALGNIAGAAGNKVISAAEQQYMQAVRDFATAVLRKESGASINPSEFDTVYRQYFPRVGDSPEVIKQKAENRKTAIESLKIQAGPGAKNIVSNAAPTAPQVDYSKMSDAEIKKALGL